MSEEQDQQFHFREYPVRITNGRYYRYKVTVGSQVEVTDAIFGDWSLRRLIKKMAKRQATRDQQEQYPDSRVVVAPDGNVLWKR